MGGSGRIRVILWGLAFLLVTLTAGSAVPGGGADRPGAVSPVSDASLFAQELRTAGALKFYENTEDLLRVAQFERALLRYLFLKGQIRGQPGYLPLVLSINQRLDFLKSQLRLSDREFKYLRPPKLTRKAPLKRAKTQPVSSPGKAPPDARVKENPQRAVTSPAPEAVGSPAHRQAESSGPPASQTNPPGKPGEEVKSLQPPRQPPRPLSRWQRLKRRLLFWKRW